jgi:uncharacterized protein with PQ loop repeat
MNEAMIANLALVFRVLLVGGILLILPRITRRGLLFGAYIGEALADHDAAREVLRRWYIGCVMLMVLSLLVGLGISLAGRPIAGNFAGTALLLLGGFGLYLRFYSWARKLAPPDAARQAERAAAPLVGGEPKGVGLAKFALGVCVLTSLATFAYAMGSHEGSWSDESFITVMFVPSVNLVLSPFLALIALLTATAKRSVRGGSGGRSVEAQNAFRAIITHVLTWMALLLCAFMTLLSVQVIRILRTEVISLGVGIWLMAGIVFVFFFGNLIRIVKEYGQGGALRERGTVEAPLTNGLANNAHWVWGLFYVDRNDPSIMVERRFGIGYTLNYGNRRAILIVVTFLMLSLSLVALALVGTLMGSG